jgi:hypothetical protein
MVMKVFYTNLLLLDLPPDVLGKDVLLLMFFKG